MTLFAALLHALDEHFGLDSRGRLGGGEGPAPLFLLLRCEQGVAWRFDSRLQASKVIGAARLAGREPPLAATDGAPPPPERLEAILRILEGETALRLRCWRLEGESGDELVWLPWRETPSGEPLAADLWLIR